MKKIFLTVLVLTALCPSAAQADDAFEKVRKRIEQELVELAEEIVRAFSLRVQAGQVSPLELSRAEVALATTRITYEEGLRGLEAARAFLAANWGGKGAAFARTAGRLDETRPVPLWKNTSGAT